MGYPLATTPTREQLLDAYSIPDRSRPRVRINFISSADGAGTFSGHSGGLGGPTDRQLLHLLRTMADCVIVGAGTVRSEGYGGLGVGGGHRVATGHGLPTTAVGCRHQPARPVPEDEVFTAQTSPRGRNLCRRPAGADEALCKIADVTICGDDAVDSQVLVEELAERGLPQMLCEGGPHLFGSFLDADLVDEVCLTISPMFTAGDAPRIAASEQQLERRFDLGSVIPDADGFVFLRYVRP